MSIGVDVVIRRRDWAVAQGARALVGGAMVGGGMSSVFALLLMERTLVVALGEAGAGLALMALTIGAVYAAGASWAWLVGASRGRRLAVGLLFVGVAFVGLLLPLGLEPLGRSS